MRHFIIIISFSICSLTAFAQTSSIDSLIKKINNNQLIGVCHYFWVLEMKSPAGYSLIAIGKPVTQRLLPLLTDTEKGIIAHYILSNIWLDSVTSWSSFARFDKEKIVDYEYCKLKFFSTHIMGKTQMTATQKDLEDNKKRWLALLGQTNFATPTSADMQHGSVWLRICAKEKLFAQIPFAQ